MLLGRPPWWRNLRPLSTWPKAAYCYARAALTMPAYAPVGATRRGRHAAVAAAVWLLDCVGADSTATYRSDRRTGRSDQRASGWKRSAATTSRPDAGRATVARPTYVTSVAARIVRDRGRAHRPLGHPEMCATLH